MEALTAAGRRRSQKAGCEAGFDCLLSLPMAWHTATVSQGATLMSCCKHPVTVCAWWLLPQTKEFAELAASVAQLGRRVARVTGAPGALSDTERALAAAQVGVGQARARVPSRACVFVCRCSSARLVNCRLSHRVTRCRAMAIIA